MRHRKRHALLTHCGMLVCYALLTCLFLWPLPLHLTNGLLEAESGDPLLQIWAVQWNIHKLSTSLTHYFDANIFYPYKNTFAYHDHMFGLGLLGWPVYTITHNPIFTYNLLLMLSFLLSAYGMYWLVKGLTRNTYAAFLAGLIFGFLPYRFAHLDHLNLLSIQWFPLCFFFLTRLLFSRPGTLGRRRNVRILWAIVGFWGCFLLQTLTSFNYLFMLVFAVGLYSIAVVIAQIVLYKRVLFSIRAVTFWVIGGCLVGVVLLPFVMPYVRANQELGFERTVEEAQGLAARPPNYLAAPETNWLYGDVTRRFRSSTSPFPREQILFPGLFPILLAAIGLLGQRKKFSNVPCRQGFSSLVLGGGNTAQNFTILKLALLAVLLVATVLSFGPSALLFGRTITLPYAWLYQYMPGFKSMRVPARFGLLAAFALTLLATIGAAYLHTWWECRKGKQSTLKYLLATLLIGGIIGAEYYSLPKSLTFYPGTVETIPEVYQWLAQQPDETRIIELPVRSAKDDFAYSYYSTFHWKSLVNGRSAFIPDGITQLFGAMRSFPAQQTIDLLTSLDVDYVILHQDRMTADESFSSPENLTLVQQFGSDLVLKLPETVSPVDKLQIDWYLPTGLRPAENYTMSVTLTPKSQKPISLLPQEKVAVQFDWQQVEHVVYTEKKLLKLPILLQPGGQTTYRFAITTPVESGEYELVMQTDPNFVERATITVSMTLASENLDSRQPGKLQAQFFTVEVPDAWTAGNPLPVRIDVRNTGNMLWKARVADRQHPVGEVHLGVLNWQDTLSDAPLAHQGELQVSRGFLPYDIGPGQECTIRAEIRTPTIPGEYVVELNLVSELLRWFDSPPLRVHVTLENEP